MEALLELKLLLWVEGHVEVLVTNFWCLRKHMPSPWKTPGTQHHDAQGTCLGIGEVLPPCGNVL